MGFQQFSMRHLLAVVTAVSVILSTLALTPISRLGVLAVLLWAAVIFRVLIADLYSPSPLKNAMEVLCGSLVLLIPIAILVMEIFRRFGR